MDQDIHESVISLKNVSVCHEDGVLLSHVNLSVRRGEFVYLIGKSGAGKTSLLRMLYGDVPVDDGEASVCGFDLQHLKRREIPKLRRKLGIVFQNARLLPDRNVYDNLYFVLRATGWKRKEIDAQIMKTLELVGMKDKMSVYPHRLSEGEQQRVGIARALINNPELILADEPTGNLDPITSSEIIGLLVDLNKNSNTTMLVSTHDFMMIDKYQSRVVCCENGTLLDPDNK
ncbi:MAG: ATP-binding cassette domain-containing protein [Bacteroidales bacterium]|nr:ATP-binding cassette domain-containing protein [Candidatus Colimorpha pelethequi]